MYIAGLALPGNGRLISQISLPLFASYTRILLSKLDEPMNKKTFDVTTPEP